LYTTFKRCSMSDEAVATVLVDVYYPVATAPLARVK